MIDKETLAQASRDALGLYFENSKNYEQYMFTLEEKTDYEVMHLVATGKFPSEQYSLSEHEVITKIVSRETEIIAERIFVNPIKYWRDTIKAINPGNIIDAKFTELYEKLPKYNLNDYATRIKNIEVAAKAPGIDAAEKARMLKIKDVMIKQIDRHGDSYNYEEIAAKLDKARASLKGSDSIGSVLAKFAGNTLLTIGALAAVALVIYYGYKVYQRFFSEAGKACNQYGGEMKTKCMKKYKSDSIKRQIVEIEKGMALCDRTNDVHRCQEMLHQKIRQLKAQMRQLA